ncbi:hypothetical protein ACE193_19835 [Bernardetia sp. OM2101]|uniref:hypothetical protein n=1 Tax=Bernardetia sp. OM2101 TaxID=3344876 RepID=UPI0035CEFDF6
MKTFPFSSFFKTKTPKKIIGTLACCVFLGVGGNSVFAQNNLHVKLPYDPYNNPAIWAQLQQKPLDSLLWQKYTHKQWTEMPLKERLQVKLWIQEMWLNQLNGNTEQLASTTVKKDEKNEKVKSEKIENTTTTQVTKTDNTVVAKKDEKVKDKTLTTTITSKDEVKEIVTSTKSLNKSQKINELLAKPEVKSFLKDLEESFLAESTEMEELKENLYENFFILEAVLADEFEVLGAEYVFYKKKYPKGNYSESRWMMEKEQELRKLKTQKLEEMKQAFLERQIN